MQKYIDLPLLWNKRKFDIRCWVLVTSNLDVFFFKEGYIRTSSKDFVLDDIGDIFIHLTNNAIQKQSQDYNKFEEGNQLSFEHLNQFLVENFSKTIEETIIPQIQKLIKVTFKSVANKLNSNQRRNCFEIFGFDFLIDANLKVWIIEVNTNPCLEESSALLRNLIPKMIDEALKQTLDK